MTLPNQTTLVSLQGLPKLAIAVDDADSYSKTFIRQHIQKLFDGQTVVLQTDYPTGSPSEKPIYYFARSWGGNFWARLLALFRLKPKAPRSFLTFCSQNHVNCVLAEFGYVGIRVYSPVTSARLPMLCYFRGSDASKHLSSPRYVNQLKEMVREIDGIVAVSRHLIENLAAHGVTHKNSLVIPSGVNTDLFTPGIKESQLVVSVGRFISKKKPLFTLRAFAQVAAKFPHARFEMVGDGEQLEECQAWVLAQGFAGRIVFHGVKPHTFVRNLLGRAEIYLQHFVTSEDGNSEGMPSAIQEAMASGAVVVTSRHAGIPDHVVDGVNGRMVAEHDFDAFVAALEATLSNPTQRIKMSQEARIYAQTFLDHKILYQRLEQQLSLIIKAKK